MKSECFRTTVRVTQKSRVRAYNKRLKRDCQSVAFPVPLSRGGYGCCVLSRGGFGLLCLSLVLCVVSPLGGRYIIAILVFGINK